MPCLPIPATCRTSSSMATRLGLFTRLQRPKYFVHYSSKSYLGLLSVLFIFCLVNFHVVWNHFISVSVALMSGWGFPKQWHTPGYSGQPSCSPICARGAKLLGRAAPSLCQFYFLGLHLGSEQPLLWNPSGD